MTHTEAATRPCKPPHPVADVDSNNFSVKCVVSNSLEIRACPDASNQQETIVLGQNLHFSLHWRALLLKLVPFTHLDNKAKRSHHTLLPTTDDPVRRLKSVLTFLPAFCIEQLHSHFARDAPKLLSIGKPWLQVYCCPVR